MQTKNIYTGIVVTLNVDTVTLPNGLTVDLEVVRHPGAAAVVPLKDDGTVILIGSSAMRQEGSSTKSLRGNFILVRTPASVRHENLRKKLDTAPAGLNSSPASSRRLGSPTKSSISTRRPG